MYCPHCGGEFDRPQDGLCPHCGNSVPETSGHEGAGTGDAAPPAPAGPDGGGAPPPPPGSGHGEPIPYAPFEDPSKGFFDGLVDTVKGVFGAPGEFYRRMPDTSDIGKPVLFFLVLAVMGNLFKAAWGILLSAAALPFQQDPEQIRQALEQAGWPQQLIELMVSMQGGGGIAAQAVATVIVNPLLGLIGLFIGTAILHVLLMLYGGANRDFGATFRVSAYAASLQLLLLVPLCGEMVALVWSLVVTCIGLAAAHRTDGWRATLAVLTPLILCVVCCGIGIIGLIGAIAGQASP